MQVKRLRKEEFATRINKSIRQLDRYIKAGKYVPIKVGKQLMFDESQLPNKETKEGGK